MIGHRDSATTKRAIHLSPAAMADAIRQLEATACAAEGNVSVWKDLGGEPHCPQLEPARRVDPGP